MSNQSSGSDSEVHGKRMTAAAWPMPKGISIPLHSHYLSFKSPLLYVSIIFNTVSRYHDVSDPFLGGMFACV